MIGVRHTIEFVKEQFEKEGYVLLNDKYVNACHKLDYICPKGHKHSITYGNWREGCRCAVCAKNIKHTIEFVREQFENEGYVLLTTKYVNQKQKLDYICVEGHKHSITWTDWYNGGYRCPTCWSIRIMGDGNNQWKGGLSYGGYCPIWKDKVFKNEIRDRDGNICLNPMCVGNTNYDLIVHHIDYNKENCGKNNLVTVCRICNIKANSNREWHTEWYRTILKKRYNYNY